MNRFNKKWVLTAIVIVLTSLLLFSVNSEYLPLFPAQEAPVTRGIEMGPIMPGFVIMQEIRMKKSHLNGIALLLGRTGNQPTGETMILLLDHRFTIRGTLKFSMSNVKELDYYSLRFPSRIMIGSGQTCYIAIYAPDDAHDQMLIGRNASPETGKTMVIPITNHDVLTSLKKTGSAMTFPGSLCTKTYESEMFYIAPVSWFIALLSVLVIFVILFLNKVMGWLSKINLQLHFVFLAYSLIFGHLFLLFTPPLQVPDEQVHLYRSYQIATGNLFKFSESVPVSITKMDTVFRRLYFNRYEKTGIEEIRAQTTATINPSEKVNVFSPDYLIPFIPQSLGVLTGSIVSDSPVIMVYLGRLFNLWISVLIIFFAIRQVPFQKWLFFLLGTMPMTLYLLASLSYDALTIALSFLLISKILQFAYEPGFTLKRKDITLLIVILMLLAMCKPPYFLMGLLFLIIPVQRAGTLKKYLVYATLLLLATVAATQVWPLAKHIKPVPQAPSQSKLHPSGELHRGDYRASGTTFSTTANHPGIKPVDSDLVVARMDIQHNVAFPSNPADLGIERNAETKPAATFDNLPIVANTSQQTTADANNPPADISPGDQLDFILANPGRYIVTLWNTFDLAGNSYIVSFIGKFGWLFVPLPVWLIIAFYIMLFAVSLINSNETIRIPWKSKLAFLLMFLVVSVLVETAMYLGWNAVGSTFIDGVQGRYFIPVAPLFFLLFYNNILKQKLVLLTRPKDLRNYKGSWKATAAKMKHKRPVNQHQPGTPVKQIEKGTAAEAVPVNLPVHFLSLVVVVFTLVSLVTSVYVILERFYVILN